MRLMNVQTSYDAATDTRVYHVSGQVFFASAEIFADQFDLRDTVRAVRIDLTAAHLWDVTAVGALEDIVKKMRHHGLRSEEHTSELQSLMRISYAVFCLKKKKTQTTTTPPI